MKTLQYIWVLGDRTLRREEGLGYDDPVPFVTLDEFLQCAHLYETFHQTYQLVFNIHPFRFVREIVRPRRFYPGDFTPKPNLLMEELVTVLTPLLNHILGLTLPSFIRGSTMEDLAAGQYSHGFLARTPEAHSTVCQPDWRSLYFPVLPLMSMMDPTGHVTKNLPRTLWVPFSWIPEPQRKALRLKEPKQKRPALVREWGPNEHQIQLRVGQKSCEPKTRLEPVVGPIQFRGQAQLPPDVADLVAKLKISFDRELPILAVRGPTGSERTLVSVVSVEASIARATSRISASPDRSQPSQASGSTPGRHDDGQVRAPQQLIPPIFPVTKATLPAGILQLTPQQMWGVVVNWYAAQNEARLRWAKDNGKNLDEASFSHPLA
ncbi:uncharacterized protein B0T15DRAFT_187697 [Chaetomium strumarium]|uniref:Uncharacterized protein n=1 Tax=Chaetomium strumarium TaxID=1170767 RepID=A0AAJ0GSD8_9PEZI|nr:hypothetical protein B0T15DRAFT_187697 [Chaetomium strumarium]